MNQKFNTSRQYLVEKIFIPEPPQQGQVWTNLNVTILPDYLAYLKQQLTTEERIVLSDYHLQTYLLQAALKPHPKNDFDICTSEILAHIRSHEEFWVRKKGLEQESLKMHQAIEEYHKDCQTINECKSSLEYIELQTEYKPNTDKIIPGDYLYYGNQFIKSAHRFLGNLYPWLGQYVADSNSDVKDKGEFKIFALEFVMNLAAKARPRYKQFYPYGQNQNSLGKQIQNQLKLFTDHVESKNVDTKSLSSPKDYYVISNALMITKEFANHFNGESKGPQTQSDLTERVQEIYSDLVNRFINKDQLKLVIDFLRAKEFRRICQIAKARVLTEQSSKEKWVGLCGSTEEDIEKVFQNYNGIINHPENMNLMKYKLEGSEVGWSDQLYLKFLEKFLQFFNVPTNNKKIAAAMGKDIEPNHVKHVKGIYMRNMASRIDNGEIGGGKKGIFESKIQFLKKDIQNFNIRWFKKEAKGKTKKIKKRRKREAFDDEQHDSDY